MNLKEAFQIVEDHHHDLERDDPDGPGFVQRWSCKHCQRALLRHEGNIYGSALTTDCSKTTVN